MKMSAMDFNEWEDEEEEDFVPDDDDEEEEEGDYDDDEDDNDIHPGGFPPVLQGEIFFDKTKRLCYEQEGLFCLVCKTSIPAGSFAFETPLICTPLVFAGWIHDPSRTLEFEVLFSEEPLSKDPLQIELLEAQEKKESCDRLSKGRKTDNKNFDDDWIGKKNPEKRVLKAPPSYCVEKKSGDSETPPANLKGGNETIEGKINYLEFPNTRNPAPSAIENDSKIRTKKNTIFVVSGSQIFNGKDDTSVSFRGAYRCPLGASVERLHLICPIQTLDKSESASVEGGATAVAVAAASKKRDRSRIDDDESVEGNVGVAYQELIDLHDDTRLSTEELKNKYYGNGGEKSEYGIEKASNKKRFKGTKGKAKLKKDDDDDDDDDDAYGF